MRFLKIYIVFLFAFFAINFSEAKSLKLEVDSQTIYAPARYQVDGCIALLSYPTIGVSRFLGKDLFSKNLFYIRFSNSNLLGLGKGIDWNVINPELSIGYLRGHFEANLGIMALGSIGPHNTTPSFNIGIHSDIHKKAICWRFGVGFPEILYLGAQVGLGKRTSKMIAKSSL